MGSSQILSPKASIDEALEFLGMSNMDKAMGIQALLRISEFEALPLFFDQHLTCVPASMKYGDQFDEYGKYVETRLVNPKDERKFWSMHIPYFYLLSESKDNTLIFNIGGVIHDGIEYNICEGNRRVAGYISIGYEKFYFDRVQLINFKTEYSARFSESQKMKDSPSKKAGVLELRKTAFKYWLVGNSGKSIHKREDLQSCYESRREPTREEVWQRLYLMDNKLFGPGKDDFIKAMGSVIQFTKGTSKGRR